MFRYVGHRDRHAEQTRDAPIKICTRCLLFYFIFSKFYFRVLFARLVDDVRQNFFFFSAPHPLSCFLCVSLSGLSSRVNLLTSRISRVYTIRVSVFCRRRKRQEVGKSTETRIVSARVVKLFFVSDSSTVFANKEFCYFVFSIFGNVFEMYG